MNAQSRVITYVLLFKFTNHIVKKEHFIRNINFSCSILVFLFLTRRNGKDNDYFGSRSREFSLGLMKNSLRFLSLSFFISISIWNPAVCEWEWFQIIPRLRNGCWCGEEDAVGCRSRSWRSTGRWSGPGESKEGGGCEDHEARAEGDERESVNICQYVYIDNPN